MNYTHARQTMREAVDRLAIGTDSLQVRVFNAFRSFAPLNEGEIPDHLQTDMSWLMECFVNGTLVDGREAHVVAQKICDVAFDLYDGSATT